MALGPIVPVELPLAGTGDIAGAAKVLFGSHGLVLFDRRGTLLLGWCIPTLAVNLLQVAFGCIVSCKLVWLDVSNIAGGTVVLLRRLSLLAVVLLVLLDLVQCILLEAEISLALPGTEVVIILGDFTLVIVGVVDPVLLLDLSSQSFELFFGEIEIASDAFYHSIVTT